MKTELGQKYRHKATQSILTYTKPYESDRITLECKEWSWTGSLENFQTEFEPVSEKPIK